MSEGDAGYLKNSCKNEYMRILCYKSFLQKLAMDHICRDCTSMYRCSSKKNKNSIYIFSVSLLTGDVPNWPGTFFLEIC